MVANQPKEPAKVSVVDGVTLETRFRDVLDALFAFVGFFSHDGIVLETNQAPLAASGLRAPTWWAGASSTSPGSAIRRRSGHGSVRRLAAPRAARRRGSRPAWCR